MIPIEHGAIFTCLVFCCQCPNIMPTNDDGSVYGSGDGGEPEEKEQIEYYQNEK